MSQKDYWEQVYSTKPTEKLGWFEPHLRTSLSWIKGLSLAVDAPIIDIGGGASTLVDDVLDAGYQSQSSICPKKLCSRLKHGWAKKQNGLHGWLAI